jgi:hypothetical protein
VSIGVFVCVVDNPTSFKISGENFFIPLPVCISVGYFVFKGAISNQAYNKLQPIKIVNKKGDLEDIVEASDQLNLQALSKPVRKFFICYPKKMELA